MSECWGFFFFKRAHCVADFMPCVCCVCWFLQLVTYFLIGTLPWIDNFAHFGSVCARARVLRSGHCHVIVCACLFVSWCPLLRSPPLLTCVAARWATCLHALDSTSTLCLCCWCRGFVFGAVAAVVFVPYVTFGKFDAIKKRYVCV